MPSIKLKFTAVALLVVSIVGIAAVIPAVDTLYAARRSKLDQSSRDVSAETFGKLREQAYVAIDDAYTARKAAVYVAGGAGVILALVILLWSRDAAIIKNEDRA